MTTEAPQQPIVDILNATPEELIIYRQLAMQRFDWFCVFVCGYWVTPFHAKMIAHRFASKTNMLLAPRGCLVGASLVTLADGSRRTIEDLVTTKYDGEVMTMTPEYKIRTSKVTNWFNHGEQDVKWVRTRAGRELLLTGNHPLFTVDGWQPVDALTIGSRIAAPRELPRTGAPNTITPEEAAVLGYKEAGIRIDNKYDTSRNKVQLAAKIDQNEDLYNLAASDLFWDEITDIEYFGTECVYDITVDETHNFIANNLVVHNSGKSLILDVAYLLWRILRDPNLRICIASKTGPQSKSFLGQIKQHMDNNDKFIKLFGSLRGDTWNEDEITVSTRTKILKEPTICAKAVGSGVPGFHFDIILADDLCDLENTATENQRNKMHQWFYIVLAPTLEPYGEFYVLGTRYHSDDIYGWFAAPKKDANGQLVPGKWNDKRFGPNTAVIPALVIDEDGTESSFWPEYFPLEYLRDKREEGILGFNLAYQNDASISEGGIIKLEDLEKYTWTDYSQIPPLDQMVIFQGCDPAISQKQNADYFAHCTLAVHQNRDIYILDITKHRFTFNEQVDYLMQQQAKWGAVLVGIETIAFQKALVQAIKDRSSWFPVHEVRPRVDKTMRAKILSAFTQRHEIHFHSSHFEAMENLAGMPNPGSKHDDLFDAVDIAVEAAKQMALNQNIITRLPSNFRGR